MTDLLVSEQFDPILAYKEFGGPAAIEQEPLRQPYSVYSGSYMTNVILADAGPRAVTMFTGRVREMFPDYVVLVAIGIVKNALTVYVVAKGVDVNLTRKLFELKGLSEDEQGASFELHVKFGEGRNPRDLIPAGFLQI